MMTTSTHQDCGPYWLAQPATPPPAAGWPLLLFLHGAGERGTDLAGAVVHGPPKRILQGHDFPGLVVAPVCPERRWWPLGRLDRLLTLLAARYPVDPARILLTGLSMGGYATWCLGCEQPERFAALVPICGGGYPARIPRLRPVPVWAFHGADDGVVPLRESEVLVAALRAAGGNVRLSIYPRTGHDSWSAAYNYPALYDWLLGQRRTPG